MKKLLCIFLVFAVSVYADSTNVIFHHNVTDAGESAIVDSIIYHQIYYLDDSVGAGSWTGPDTGTFWDTVTINNVYLFGLSAALTYYLSNPFDDTEYVLVNNVEAEFVANTAGGADSCTVYGYVGDIGISPLERATVTMTLRGNNILDTCNDILIAYYSEKTTSNSLGYWSMPVRKTQCCSPTKTYDLLITWGSGGKYERKNITVPDSASYKIQ